MKISQSRFMSKLDSVCYSQADDQQQCTITISKIQHETCCDRKITKIQQKPQVSLSQRDTHTNTAIDLLHLTHTQTQTLSVVCQVARKHKHTHSSLISVCVCLCVSTTRYFTVVAPVISLDVLFAFNSVVNCAFFVCLLFVDLPPVCVDNYQERDIRYSFIVALIINFIRFLSVTNMKCDFSCGINDRKSFSGGERALKSGKISNKRRFHYRMRSIFPFAQGVLFTKR